MVDEAVLPRGLCRQCSEDAMTAFHFRELCARSKIQWERVTTCIADIQEPTNSDKTLYMFFGDEISIVTDQINAVSNVEEAMNRLNNKFNKPQVEEKPPRRSKRIFEIISCACPDCGKKFNNPEFLNYHLRSSLKSACRKCGSVVPNSALLKHLSTVHGITVIDCYVCNAVFNERSEFEQHWIATHGPNTHSCCYCGAGFTNSRALRAHMYCHTLFHCKSCNNSFNNRKCYKYHQKQCKIKEEPKQSVFICDYCNVEYNKKPSLKVHIIQKHLNVLPFTCQECGKRASTLGHLKSHQKTHKEQRKIFQCYCGAKMRTELGYQLHQRIHTGERPYECETCGDRFLSASRRLDHMKRRHRGTMELPHACEKCSARFIRPWELKKHYLSVHFDVIDVPKKTNDGPIKRRFKTKC